MATAHHQQTNQATLLPDSPSLALTTSPSRRFYANPSCPFFLIQPQKRPFSPDTAASEDRAATLLNLNAIAQPAREPEPMPLQLESSPLLGGRRAPASPSVPLRSPFETGFPVLFGSPPIPSPRPHRLSFAYDKHDYHRALHVFLTLLMSTVGAGMLSVPYTFLLSPTWLAAAGVAGVGAAMALTAHALLLAHVQLAAREEARTHIGAGRRFASFQTIAVVAGGRALGYVVSVTTAVGIYGGCVGNVRIVADIAPFLVEAAYALAAPPQNGAEPLNSEALTQLGSYLMWATFALVVFPLCLMKNLSGLRVSSYLGFAFSLYLLSTIIYRSFVALPSTPSATGSEPVNNATTPAPGDPDDIVSAVGGVLKAAADAAGAITTSEPTRIVGPPFSRFTQSISIYNYAFMMHLNLVPLFIQLRGNFAEPLKQTSRKMTQSIIGISSFCVVLYVTFGFFSKKLYGAAVRGNILLNLENDPVMQIPLVAVFFTVIMSFPLLFHPLRGVLEELCFSSNLEEIAPATRLGATTVLLLSQVLVALCVPGIQVVFGLTGASCCLMICIVFPVLFYTKLYPWHSMRGGKLFITLLWLIALVFTAIGAVATVFLLSSP